MISLIWDLINSSKSRIFVAISLSDKAALSFRHPILPVMLQKLLASRLLHIALIDWDKRVDGVSGSIASV